MRLTVIATGSKGNCYALRSEDAILLLDAGVGIRRVMRTLGRSMADVIGVLVTHEHKDHAGHVTEYMRMCIRVFTSKLTAEAVGIDKDPMFTDITSFHAPGRLGPFTVLPFSVMHDAVDPLGFLIRCKDELAVFATDTYYLKNRFAGVNYWIIECNHIRELMDRQASDGYIAETMRRRLITSHMSLERLLDVFRANDMNAAREIVLIHLSDERSDESEMVRQVEELTHIHTTAAASGTDIELNLVPF